MNRIEVVYWNTNNRVMRIAVDLAFLINRQ